MITAILAPVDVFGPAFDRSPVAQAILDGSWRLAQANRAWTMRFASAIPTSWLDLVHPEDIERHLPLAGRMQTGDAAGFRADARLAAAGGGWRAAAIEAAALDDGAVLITALDPAAPPAAADAAADHRALAAAMSHDLKQHVRLTGAYLSLLGRSSLEGKQRAHLDVASEQNQRLMHVLGELVRWLRLPDEQLDRVPCDPGQAWDEAIARLPADLAGRLVEAPPVRAPAGLAIVADRELLIDLLCIVLDNAVRYHPGRAKVVCSVSAADGGCAIAIADDGPGIPADERLRVLEPLRRLHTWDQARGHGMGLSVAARIAAVHGGCLRIGETQGGGCTVHIRLPG